MPFEKPCVSFEQYVDERFLALEVFEAVANVSVAQTAI